MSFVCIAALLLLMQRLNSDNLAAFCLDSVAEKVLRTGCYCMILVYGNPFSLSVFHMHHCFFIISSAVSIHMSWSQYCLSVWLDVNRGGTAHSCCTQRFVILHAQTY